MDSDAKNIRTLPHLQDSSLAMEGRIAVLTFQRDDVRNALTGTALIDDIVKTVGWANEEQGVSVLIITGAGAAFSSGGNVKEMQEKNKLTVTDAQTVAVAQKAGKATASALKSHPELNASALAPLRAALPPGCGAGFSSSRTCEIGLSLHAGIPYRPLAWLVDRCAAPRAAGRDPPIIAPAPPLEKASGSR